MNNIGIMQGRLTESRGRGIQFFPFENWENEFYLAKALGIDEIEFIFDYDRFEENPLWTETGLKRIKRVIEESRVSVNAICFDYFMRRPFYRGDTGVRQDQLLKENSLMLTKIIYAAEQIGCELIEIPIVDNSSIESYEQEERFKAFLINIMEKGRSTIQLGLETDFPPQKFIKFLKSFRAKWLVANYDSGNSSGLGYDLYEEVTTLGDYIANIHIKDRIYQGNSVDLGTGDASFLQLFKAIREINYSGSFILQAARGFDGNEKENIKQQIGFLLNYMKV